MEGPGRLVHLSMGVLKSIEFSIKISMEAKWEKILTAGRRFSYPWIWREGILGRLLVLLGVIKPKIVLAFADRLDVEISHPMNRPSVGRHIELVGIMLYFGN